MAGMVGVVKPKQHFRFGKEIPLASKKNIM